MAERYDTLVLGGGMAGLPLALRAARHGRVAFVEKEKLGGTCLNRGCIPTKTMIASAAVAQQVRRAAPSSPSRPVLDARALRPPPRVGGGGYAGCEFAQMFALFGPPAPAIHRAERLFPAEAPAPPTAGAAGMPADGSPVITATTCTD